MSEVKFDFRGKNFAVTGASSGIGKQVALELLQAGANVMAVARRKELLDEIYKDYSDQVFTAKVDVKTPEDWDEPIKEFVQTKGKFHGAVYAAGITGLISLKMYDANFAKDIIDTNFFGVIESFRRLIKASNCHKDSSHVWITSVAAHNGSKGEFIYSASKGALLSAMHSLVKDISGKGHRLNCISPGWIDTEMTQNFTKNTGLEKSFAVQRQIMGAGKPDNISGIALFLLSDRASWITGAEIGGGGYLSS